MFPVNIPGCLGSQGAFENSRRAGGFLSEVLMVVLREAASMALTCFCLGMLMEVDSFGGEDGDASSFGENDCL